MLKTKGRELQKEGAIATRGRKKAFFQSTNYTVPLDLESFLLKKNTNGASDKSRNCGRTERIMARFVLNAPASRV